MLDQYSKCAKDLGLPSPLGAVPLCAAFHARFKALPTLQKYFASDVYTKAAVNAPSIANWS